MKKTLNLVSLVFAFLMLSGMAKADQLVFTTTMTGAQEVPPTGSPGIGSALVTIRNCYELDDGQRCLRRTCESNNHRSHSLLRGGRWNCDPRDNGSVVSGFSSGRDYWYLFTDI